MLTWLSLLVKLVSCKAAPITSLHLQSHNLVSILQLEQYNPVQLDGLYKLLSEGWRGFVLQPAREAFCSSIHRTCLFQNCSCPLRSAARSLKTCARKLSGSATTVGFPRSASSQMLGWRGMSASSLMFISSHFLMTPSRPKIECVVEQVGHVNADMF